MGAIATTRLLLRKTRILLMRRMRLGGPTVAEYALMAALVITVVAIAVLTLR
jgi:hypothetical protein